jgi:hypothetical protein
MLCFNSWFSGFVDGEGSFLIVKNKSESSIGGKVYVPVLCITLRNDDAKTLITIRDNLRLGGINFYDCKQKPTHGGKCRFRVSGIKQCQKLIPIFDTYPLQSKKHNDYLVWKSFILQKIEFGTKLPKSIAEYHYNRIKEVRHYNEYTAKQFETSFREVSYRKDSLGKVSL